MIEILQLLFATAKDQNLYFNQDSLIKELLVEYKFSPNEIQDAIEWFAPIINGGRDLEINPTAIRSISSWEEKHLPKVILAQILEWERTKVINLVEREILLDRLVELGLDWQLETEDMQEIMEGLIYHLQHYKYALMTYGSTKSPYFWASNCTVH